MHFLHVAKMVIDAIEYLPFFVNNVVPHVTGPWY